VVPDKVYTWQRPQNVPRAADSHAVSIQVMVTLQLTSVHLQILGAGLPMAPKHLSIPWHQALPWANAGSQQTPRARPACCLECVTHSLLLLLGPLYPCRWQVCCLGTQS
jgi:hypothetical protein